MPHAARAGSGRKATASWSEDSTGLMKPGEEAKISSMGRFVISVYLLPEPMKQG
jgi:hypothetical protein